MQWSYHVFYTGALAEYCSVDQLLQAMITGTPVKLNLRSYKISGTCFLIATALYVCVDYARTAFLWCLIKACPRRLVL